MVVAVCNETREGMVKGVTAVAGGIKLKNNMSVLRLCELCTNMISGKTVLCF